MNTQNNASDNEESDLNNQVKNLLNQIKLAHKEFTENTDNLIAELEIESRELEAESSEIEKDLAKISNDATKKSKEVIEEMLAYDPEADSK